MNTRKRDTLPSKRAKRPRFEEPSNQGSSGVGAELINYMDQKLGEIMQRIDKIESNSSIASSSTTEIRTIHHTDESSTIPEVEAVKTTNVFVMKPVIDQPKYDGLSGLSPVRFIDRLRRYIKYVNAGEKSIEIALECLSGAPQKIMELYKEKWVNLEDFINDFLGVYWGTTEQENAKIKLMNTTWYPNRGVTMEEHFAQQMDNVKQLTIPLTESDIVKSIMHHFPEDIQRLWFTREESATALRAIKFLRDIEKNVMVHKGRTGFTTQRVDNRETIRDFHAGRGVGRGRQTFYNQNRLDSTAKTMQANVLDSSTRGRGRGNFRGNSLRERNPIGIYYDYNENTNWVHETDMNPTSEATNQNKDLQSNASNPSNDSSSTQGNSI